MHSSVISRWLFIFLALLVIASCGREGGKIEAGKAKSAKSATKTAETGGTVRVDSAPKRTSSKKTTSKKTDFNGVTQFQER